MKHLASGSCLCGAVTFDIAGAFENFFLCHCSRCRKDSGSAHGATLFSSVAEIVWLTGKECIRTFQLPGTRHKTSFCTLCGSALPSVHMDGALVSVPAGSLDSEIDIPPKAKICFASRANWVDGIAGAETIDGLPG